MKTIASVLIALSVLVGIASASAAPADGRWYPRDPGRESPL